MNRSTRQLVKLPALTAALACLLAVTACTPDKAPEPAPAKESVQERPEVTEQTVVSSGNVPAWASGSVDVGTSIGNSSTDSWSIEAFQVEDLGTSSKDSMFVDPDTLQNVLPEGSPVVYVNFVYTNTSDETIMVPLSFGTPDLRSEFWKYGQGQPGDSRLEEYEARGVSDRLVKLEASKDVYWFAVEPGQSISRAVNIKHEPGSARVRITFTPALNDEGDLDHANKEETDFTLQVS
jgi:hypothetical protein